MALASLVSFQKQKQGQKRYCIRFAHAVLKAKAHDSKNHLVANIFKSGFSEGGISELSLCQLVDTRLKSFIEN